MDNKPEPDVDRSRLTLLLGLTSAAAAAGCNTPNRKTEPYRTFGRQKFPTDDGDRLGGEGGEGGGSH
ncbi:hypothetical protein PZ897_00320 [Hoeflea sp. YIM 152468]|uniref:hypothetical protein n=1 Tax=Hoeflea sp. YIM 152468 TaxID=3031759 RepID=UPI0023DC90B6|nr:hypothetical protein [Hoeflea sp. YIM 152468]MDF1606610.1 hypothetical protein [Hoeflea sp. YIM 152468]